MNKTILVVDDEKPIADILQFNLIKEGYKVICAYDGDEALKKVEEEQPDLMLLDIMLPKRDGMEVCREVRKKYDFPIIMLTAKGSEIDKVLGLEMGADDYVTKPFSVEELLARIRVALRRMAYEQPLEKENPIFTNGYLQINYVDHTVFVNGKEIHVTPIEYKLLIVLSKNVGKVLTHNYILKEIWQNALQSDVPSLRVFMATLRKKIEVNPAQPKLIQTHVRVGYRMLRYHEEDE